MSVDRPSGGPWVETDRQHYPLAEITMLSNSKTQKLHIDATAAEKGFKNVTVITGDVNVYDFEEKGK